MQPSPAKPARSELSHASLHRSRRAFLRGAGVALTLPWLESLAGFTGGASALAAPRSSNLPPMRMASLFMPNGVNPADWKATQNGSALELSKTLKPLSPHTDQLFIPLGLSHNKSHRSGDGHLTRTANFLSGEKVIKTKGDNLTVGKSMDQIIADEVGGQTPLSSLVLGTEQTKRGIDNNSGFARVYGGHISWSDAHTPVAKEIYPRAVFDGLFRLQHGVDSNTSAPQFGEDASILDSVANDAARVRNRISAYDRQQLESYYDSVRQLEKRIAKMEKQAAADAWKPLKLDPQKFSRPEDGKPRDPSTHIRLMMDLMVLAFRMNVTRVSTFMFANAFSLRNMGFLDGVSGAHHTISHHGNKPATQQMYQKINHWHIEHLAYFIDQLGRIDEGGTTLLDNTMVLFGSGISDGNNHSANDLPIVAAGGPFKAKAGNYRGKRFCALHLTLMQQMGLNIQEFGDATKPLL